MIHSVVRRETLKTSITLLLNCNIRGIILYFIINYRDFRSISE
jgi:hypothetical protein